MHVKHRHLPAWLSPAPDSAVADTIKLGKSPWIDAVHLLWTMWVFITPIFDRGHNMTWVLITLWSYPLFLALYAMTLMGSRRSAPIFALGMIVLSMVLLRDYPSGISYFIFGCVMLHTNRIVRTSRYLLELIALNAAFVSLATWIGYPWQALAWIPVISVIIGIIVNVERISSEKDAALRLSHDEVRRLAATAERERIGRDLHDLLGHTLSLIALKLELSRKLFERDAGTARRELEEAEQIAREALAQVRSAVTGFRAANLAAELASAHLLLESSRVHLRYEPPPPMPAWIECGLSLVLREAATNIARHAQASEASIAVACDAEAVRLDIRDNGCGGVTANGNGLNGMRERVAALGGSLQIHSPRGGGTHLQVRIPLGQQPSVPDAAGGESAGAVPAPKARCRPAYPLPEARG
ncbi:sensor histidine kinase [Flavobacterium sp. MXW15]|uniref:Sensor histidine kinase n=1 Tax=Xanthomonas chitinilytica TaxID=2989819 RepID=A0ABT3K027_9XANT|nr:sensor histidine kinase [Xanthomonas sp. H13-6]MCW4456377.1 sensor histidine kinase [Flavobacterium sp. MXW15]MCW4474082.1 sensor histidine kinase [Xanthomonas sp. H13-6]